MEIRKMEMVVNGVFAAWRQGVKVPRRQHLSVAILAQDGVGVIFVTGCLEFSTGFSIGFQWISRCFPQVSLGFL